MKRWVCLALAGMLMLLCACGENAKDVVKTPAGKSTTTTGKLLESKGTSSTTTTQMSTTDQSTTTHRVITTTKSKTTTKKKTPTTTKKTTTTTTVAPEEPKFEGTYYEYSISGTIVDWITDDDIIYTIYENVNRYIAFDSNTGEIIKSVALPGKPGEIHLVGDELWISFPDMMKIEIHNKETFSKDEVIYFDHEVGSFDLYGDYIFYSEGDQHTNIYRYNRATDTEVQIPLNIAFEADVLVNAEDGLLYIGESSSTGAVLYCFDLETLVRKSYYKKDSYGYANKARRTFLSDGYVYWGEFRFVDTDVSRIDCQYTGSRSAGMLHVDDYFVITSYGVFDKETTELLIPLDLAQIYSAALVTESGNLMMTEFEKLYIIPNR